MSPRPVTAFHSLSFGSIASVAVDPTRMISNGGRTVELLMDLAENAIIHKGCAATSFEQPVEAANNASRALRDPSGVGRKARPMYDVVKQLFLPV